jgi:protein-tyrosine phosphatase
MTDLHCHILHDIDDGPGSLEEALALCRLALDNRIEHAAATPHIRASRADSAFLELRDLRLAELKKALADDGIPLALYPGAEVLIKDQTDTAAPLAPLTLHHSRYLLTEFPRADPGPSRLSELIAQIQSRGLIPIIAHPERYMYFQRDPGPLVSLLESGALLQVNASSLCLPRHRAEYRLAAALVRAGAADFLATDAHSVDFRPNNLLELLATISENIDYDYLDTLVNRNPERVLNDRSIDTGTRKTIDFRRLKH